MSSNSFEVSSERKITLAEQKFSGEFALATCFFIVLASFVGYLSTGFSYFNAFSAIFGVFGLVGARFAWVADNFLEAEFSESD